MQHFFFKLPKIKKKKPIQIEFENNVGRLMQFHKKKKQNRK